MQDLKIAQKWEDMMKYAYVSMRNIPRSERFTLGSEMRVALWDGLKTITRANYTKNKGIKIMPIYIQRKQIEDALDFKLERSVVRQMIENYFQGEQCREYMEHNGKDEGFTPAGVSDGDIIRMENELYELRAVRSEKEIDASAVRKLLSAKVAEVADKDVDEYASVFPAWRPVEDVVNAVDSSSGKEDRRQHNGVVWKCMVSHTTQVDWEPGIAGTLWSRVAVVDPGTGYEVWKAWDGHNESLYQEGNIVWYPTIDTTLYIATLGNNHWRPDSGTGWQVYVPV